MNPSRLFYAQGLVHLAFLDAIVVSSNQPRYSCANIGEIKVAHFLHIGPDKRLDALNAYSIS